MSFNSSFRKCVSPEFGVFFIEVPGYPAGALPDRQDLGRDLVSLPLASPGLPGGRGRDFGVEIQLVNVDSLVPGECSVAGTGLEPEPALVLEFPLPHVLTELHRAICGKEMRSHYLGKRHSAKKIP